MIKRLAGDIKARYLANILCITKVEQGSVTPEEALVLQNIAAKLRADRNDMLEARKLVESGVYQPVVLDDPPLRMANLEDMLVMALADNQLEDEEAAVIDNITAAMRFARTDVDLAVRRARGRLSKIFAQNKAAAQKQDVPENTRASRRAPRTIRRSVEPHAQISLSPPPWKIKVEDLAADGDKILSSLQADDALDIQESVADDEIADSVSCVEQCMIAREASDDPDAYCFGSCDTSINVWGCRLIDMPWVEGADWLTPGFFQNSRTFVFNRQDIRNMLEERMQGVKQCPYFNYEYAKQALAALPSKALIGSRWAYRADASDQRAEKVTVSEYIHGCPVTKDKSVSGVNPVGEAEALRVIRDACRRSNRVRPMLAQP